MGILQAVKPKLQRGNVRPAATAYAHGVSNRNRFAKFPAVKQKIRHAILRGELRPQEQLPAFHNVAKQMGVGSVTAKRAIDELVDEGWLISRRGVGTFVSPRHSLAKVVLTVPAGQGLDQLFESEQLDAFHAENPNGRIVRTADRPTDFFVGDTYGMIVDRVRDHELQNLDKLQEQFGSTKWELPPFSRRTGEWQGELYGFPLLLSVTLVQSNPRLLRSFGLAPPQRYLDWEVFAEIVARCRKDSDGDGIIDCFGSSCYLHPEEWLLPFWQNGGRLDQEESFFSDRAIGALDNWLKLIHIERTLPIEMPIMSGEVFFKQIRKRFDAEKLAVRYAHNTEFHHKNPFAADLLLPRFGPVSKQFVQGALLGITRHCAYPEMAMKYLDFCYRRHIHNNAQYPFAIDPVGREFLRERPELRDLLMEAAEQGADPLHEGIPPRTWAIEKEIIQWFRLFQNRETTLARLREHWNKFRAAAEHTTKTEPFLNLDPDAASTPMQHSDRGEQLS